jgi:CRP-like cAMP-binding protein
MSVAIGRVIGTVEKVLFLKSIDLFSQISGEDLSQIALITDEVQFEDGDEIFHQGDGGQTLFFIIEGKVRIHANGVADDLAVLSERAVFGEMALLDSEPRSASATALTDVVCLKIERDDFNEILAEKSEIAQGIIKVLIRRLRSTLDRQRVSGPVTKA